MSSNNTKASIVGDISNIEKIGFCDKLKELKIREVA